MVTHVGQAPSRLSKSLARSLESNMGDRAGEAHRSSSENEQKNTEDIDFAIAQLASGLRILLNLDLSFDNGILNRRSYDMSTNASSINANDRYDVLVVENYEDGAGAEKSSWTRVGVAFPHKDGNGLNVELRAMPVNGKLVIRRHESK
jgi:hypothetical protein